MGILLLPFQARFLALTVCFTGSVILSLILAFHPESVWVVAAPLAIAAGFTLLGLRDITQTSHSVLRNYPILAHLRFLFETIRPEMRQYFFEADTDGAPFARDKRAIVYQRAKRALDKRPFGTMQNVYADAYEWVHHSMAPKPLSTEPFRIMIGGPDCTAPYSASILNVSAMSYGALSANAIMALNKGARMGDFAHDTGEGSISPYHRKHGGDLIWELGSGYFGCRDREGRFSPETFAAVAADPQIKMIEIKLSQGAKPGHGGVLPGAKVTAEIAAIRGVEEGRDCVSPAAHSAFSTPVELLRFIAQLRSLSGGKPTGFKFCVGHPYEFFGLVKAMLETGITPDFIVIDGTEGGTGAAPLEFMDHVGTPLREGLSFVHSALVGANLRAHIKLGCSGKIATAFDMARLLALGADWCNAARSFMFALGCIQAQQCHSGGCPTGVATQDPLRQRALVVAEKARRVHNFHHETLKALAELVSAAGLERPADLAPDHFMLRASQDQVVTFARQYPCLAPGQLLTSAQDSRLPHHLAQAWAMARSDDFAPQILQRDHAGPSR
jgi:glutamate synthase domain-containing protein 2